MWTTETLIRWVCDGCGAEHVSRDDLQPEGWIHGMDGLDRCPACQG